MVSSGDLGSTNPFGGQSQKLNVWEILQIAPQGDSAKPPRRIATDLGPVNLLSVGEIVYGDNRVLSPARALEMVGLDITDQMDRLMWERFCSHRVAAVGRYRGITLGLEGSFHRVTEDGCLEGYEQRQLPILPAGIRWGYLPVSVAWLLELSESASADAVLLDGSGIAAWKVGTKEVQAFQYDRERMFAMGGEWWRASLDRQDNADRIMAEQPDVSKEEAIQLAATECDDQEFLTNPYYPLFAYFRGFLSLQDRGLVRTLNDAVSVRPGILIPPCWEATPLGLAADAERNMQSQSDPEALASKAEWNEWVDEGAAMVRARSLTQLIKEMIWVEAAELDAAAMGQKPNLIHSKFADWTPQTLSGLCGLLGSLHDATKWSEKIIVPKTPKSWGTCALPDCGRRFAAYHGNRKYCDEHMHTARGGEAARSKVRRLKNPSRKKVTESAET